MLILFSRSCYMRHLAKIQFTLTILVSFSFTLLGQSPQTVTITRPGKVASYYNAANDKTNVVLGSSDVGGESGCGLYVSANASYPGKTIRSVVEVKLTIMR